MVEADGPRLPDGVSVDNDNSDQKVACVTLSHSLSAVGSPAGGEVGGKRLVRNPVDLQSGSLKRQSVSSDKGGCGPMSHTLTGQSAARGHVIPGSPNTS